MSFAHKTRIGVLRGGPSTEYEVSLKTGQNVLNNLDEAYEPIDILISKNGVWHEKGIEKSPENILKRVDMVWNGLHGQYGEDGEVQKILDHFKIPYTGPKALSAALSMNKIATKKIFKDVGIKTPVSMSIAFENISRENIKEIYHSLPSPFIVKPVNGGSSIGVFLAKSLGELEEAIVAASHYSPKVLIEEWISGKEATCGVIENFREESHYTLPPIEIRHSNNFFDYAAKYSDQATEELCPGNFNESEKKTIQEMTRLAHQGLGLRHYSRSDFIIHPRRGIYILETNSLPGLTEKSLLPKSLEAIGSNIKEFISHILQKIRD